MSEPAVKPLPNSYWVRHGQLLAGEYPLTRNHEQSAVRLQDLLLAGMNCFIDLTAENELPPYHSRLPARFNSRPVVHHRFAITDHGVPADVSQMSRILDVIDAALSEGSCVYVHCRAGIGRTGTVIGCHLVRHGHGAEALNMLNQLWQHNARAASWPQVPETDAQTAFILEFKEQQIHRPLLVGQGRLGAFQGALLGLALGDLLGNVLPPTAIHDERAALNNLSAMHWRSDTAMMLAVADSVLACKQNDAQDQMQRYLAWQKQGKYSCDDQPGTPPAPLQKALGLWQWKRNALSGSHDPALLDAHPLARATPLVLFFANRPALALHSAAESARTSLQAAIVLDACRVFAATLLAIIEGVSLKQLMNFRDGYAFGELRTLSLKPEVLNLIDGGWRTAMTHAAGTDVLTVLASALHALATTQNFQAAILKSMQGAAQPATVGAVCGALAGALYGVHGLPIVWRETLPKSNELLALAERLAGGAGI